MTKKCNFCKNLFRVKPSHYDKRNHCSKDCMAETYKAELNGTNNPNYKGRGFKNCIQCGKKYKSYDKRRKYCCAECYNSTRMQRNIATGHYVDKNQKEIVQSLEAIGCSVLDASGIGFGFPDLIVQKEGITYLFEIKNPNSTHGLTKSQKKFHNEWKGQCSIVYSFDEAYKIIGASYE